MLALSNARVPITMVIQHDQKVEIPGVQFLRIGGLLSIGKQISLVMKVLLHPFQFRKLMNLRKELSFSQRFRWGIKYFPLSQLQPPSIVHFQWLTLIEEFQWLRHYFNCPFVGSARGSQVTVYPRTRKGFADVVRQAISQADVLHLVSKDLIPPCIHLGALPVQMLVNYNGINLEKFCPPARRQRALILKLISVGAAIWRKGYVFQLEVVKNVMALMPVSLTIVGEGPDLEGLRYLAYKLGVYEAVHFHGSATEEEVAALLQQADVYISTSAAEGLANSCMEAAACGLPVVAFACEGMNELIEHGQTGYIIPYGEVLVFAEHVHLLEDVEHRLAMGKQARQKMEREWSADYWTDEMIRHYHTICQKIPRIK